MNFNVDALDDFVELWDVKSVFAAKGDYIERKWCSFFSHLMW